MWVLCTAPLLLHSLVHGHPSNWRSLYGLPSPWLLLPLATIAAAVVEVKKSLLAPTLTMKAAWVCSVPSCHWYHCVSGVCLCAAECFSLVQEKQPCCLLIGWMTGGEFDGRSTINFPVVGKGHEVTALWSAIKRTRQIGWGALVRGRARRAGSDKGGDGDAAPHNSELDKSLRHPSDTTATPAHTRTHIDMHINIRWQHKSASPGAFTTAALENKYSHL